MLRLTTLGGLRIERDGAPVSEVRPRRLALLAILAAAGPVGLTRESVLAILWTESTPERARHSLAQSIYSLRRELNEDVIPAGPLLRLDASIIASDIRDLRAALDDKRLEAANAIYTGPFAEGFYIAEAPEFERWADAERARIHGEVVAALERLAIDQPDAADARAAWSRLTKLEPLNGRFASGFMNAAARSGDRAGALAHGQAHAKLVESELGVAADADVRRLIDDLRAASPASSPVPAATNEPARARIPMATPPARRWRPLAVGASLLLVVSVLAATFWRRSERTAARGSTNSELAARLHDGGLRAFYQGEYAAAARLFNAALAEDSSYASAAYFAWRSEVALDGPDVDRLAALALTKSRNAGVRDAQLIATHVGLSRFDIRPAAVAESLSRRFPSDPEILMRAAEAHGDLAHAVKLLEDAIRVDASTASSDDAPCRLCETFRLLARRYAWADSSTAVLRTLDRWSAARPRDYAPWLARFDYLTKLERVADASLARRRADSLGAPPRMFSAVDVERQIRAGTFSAADSLCRTTPLPNESDSRRLRLRAMCVMSLRAQGRHRAALALARSAESPRDPELSAALDLEMGRPLLAAAMHRRAAATLLASDTALSGASAHAVVWHLTLAGTALAQARDTVRLRGLVDSVELIGHRSGDPRDPLLHHFLRGVLLSASGAHGPAVREYRLASTMPAHDFSRIGYEMARSLMAARRSSEAIAPLRATLHGAFDDASLSLSPTEARLSLAEAFDAAGQPDSAAVHYAAVERAWRGADPSFAPRYEAVRAALLRTGRASR